MRRAILSVLAVAATSFLTPKSAYAYIDPGTGSYIIQVLIAALVGAAFVVNLCWARIKAFLRSKLSREQEDDPTED